MENLDKYEIKKMVIKGLCIEGLMTDGGHHKQWYLEEILKALEYDPKKISRILSDNEAEKENEDPEEYWEEYNDDGYFWKRGIIP